MIDDVHIEVFCIFSRRGSCSVAEFNFSQLHRLLIGEKRFLFECHVLSGLWGRIWSFKRPHFVDLL